MMKVYKAVHERENKCKELHKEMNMNVDKISFRLVLFINDVYFKPIVISISPFIIVLFGIMVIII